MEAVLDAAVVKKAGCAALQAEAVEELPFRDKKQFMY